jgi:hypothetical protein
MTHKWFDPSPKLELDLSAMGLVDLAGLYDDLVERGKYDEATQVRWWVRNKMTRLMADAKLADDLGVEFEDEDDYEDEDEDDG